MSQDGKKSFPDLSPDKCKIITWMDFSRQTTFHGIKNICNSKHSIFRRIFWFFIIFFIFGLFLFQVISRSIDYDKKEASVNVEILYKSEIDYPTVTLCNKNRFRFVIKLTIITFYA